MSLYKTYLFKELKKAYGKTDEWEEIKKNIRLVQKNCEKEGELFNPNKSLLHSFIWEGSPQGAYYWCRIYKGSYH